MGFHSGFHGNLLGVVKNFSMNSSLHGFVYLFTNRSFMVKKLWIVAISFTIAVCLYNMVLTGCDHLITKPSVTTLTYKPREVVQFPAITICPNYLSQKAVLVAMAVQNYSAALHTYIGYLHHNPIYSDFRKLIFMKYPKLEHSYKLMMEKFNQELGARRGDFFY